MASKVFSYTTTGTKLGSLTAPLMLCITSIRYVSATAASGDECKVTDINDNVIYDVFATGANYVDSQRFEKQPMVNGLKVATLTSGTVYIEID